MPRYREEDYSLDNALQNIGLGFFQRYQDELMTYAQHPDRSDIAEKIHSDWDEKFGLSAFGTNIRIEWAVAIYDHGDWEQAVATEKTYQHSVDMRISDPRKNYPAEFRCDNGVYVRSLSELFIADWLYHNRIAFEYEREVLFQSCQKRVHCDFYLTDYDVYIEFWGMDNEQYIAYKQWKESQYKLNGYRLLSLDFRDLKAFRDSYTHKLEACLEKKK